MLTDEGRRPPSAVYKANFPTGMPIPCNTLSKIMMRGLVHYEPKNLQHYIQEKDILLARANYLTTKVPKSQNTLTISHDNNLNIPFRPILQHLQNFSPSAIKTFIFRPNLRIDYKNQAKTNLLTSHSN